MTRDGFIAENSHQSNSARNNTREEINSDEQDLHPKWQWTTGAFVEADLVNCWPFVVQNVLFSQKLNEYAFTS